MIGRRVWWLAVLLATSGCGSDENEPGWTVYSVAVDPDTGGHYVTCRRVTAVVELRDVVVTPDVVARLSGGDPCPKGVGR